jgi:hypothetical protein
MRFIGLLYAFIFLFLQLGFTQPWAYDFGTATDSYTAASSSSTTFLPQPESGEDFVRIGSGGGGIYLENPGISGFGSETELRASASSSSSANKFSIYDYSGSQTFTIKFSVRFGGGDAGSWSFFQGDGANYSNGSNFYNSQTFTGIRWTFGNSDGLSTSYNAGGTWTDLPNVMTSQNTNYTVEIYGNNSNSSVSYNYNGSQSVAQNSYDLWVDGALVGDDLQKSELPDENNIDSYMFIGINSSGNAANIYIDDITYTNLISDQPLPVELSSFSLSAGDHCVDLIWTTESELNNAGFMIYRSENSDKHYEEIASYKYYNQLKGAGTTSIRRVYRFRDESARNNTTYWYKLYDVDFNGAAREHGPIKAYPHKKIETISGDETPRRFELHQNYPNPFNPSTTIEFSIPESSDNSSYSLNIFNMRGELIRSYYLGQISAGNYRIQWDGKNRNNMPVSNGIYIYQLKGERFCDFKKMTLMR